MYGNDMKNNNDMKRVYAIIASLAALACVSCEWLEEDVFGGGNGQSEEDRFFNVVSQLVDVKEITSDYEGKTFKPAIGTPDGGDESRRVVAVNSLEAAVARFNNLTGAEITAETKTYTYRDKAVGTLIWNLSSDNTCWATVDVSIAAVPSLQKIIYRSPEQGDVNGSVNGSAYYRFGDVISRYNEDEALEYWICVRPAFDYEGKEKSHWVSVSPLPRANVWPYNDDDVKGPFVASNGFEYGLPDKLRSDCEWYQDLAEMLFAIMYPDAWFSNIGSYSSLNIMGGPSGLPIFNDWHCDLIKYHNSDFWRNVQRQWIAKDIVKKVFGISYQDMEYMIRQPGPDGTDKGEGLYFIYGDHDWSTRFSNKPKMYQVHYYHGTKDTQKNMHLQTKSRPQAQVVEPKKKTVSNINYPLNFYDKTSLATPYVKEQRFFGDNNPRWTIRFATGAELSESGNYSAQQPIPGFNPQKDEVYRYYRDVVTDKNLTDDPEISTPIRGVINDRKAQDFSDFDGDSHYGFGDVLKDEQGNRWFVVRPSGGSEEKNPFTEKSPYTELVSFEGITYSADKKAATNIATRDQILRISLPVWFLSQEANKKKSINAGQSNIFVFYPNVKDNAAVDLLHLVQEVIIQQKYQIGGQGTAELVSFAYYQPGSQNQHLMRYICDMGPGNAFMNVYYDRYPKKVSTTNDYPGLTAADFSGDEIYLQDVADAQKVLKYADQDYMSKTAFADAQQIPRLWRSNPEPKATDVTNYFYNMTTWENGTAPLGMWNEPVLFMRVTALYDRGSEYATQSVDGHTFTMVKEGNYTVPKAVNKDNPYSWLMQGMAYQQPQDRWINGVSGESSAIPSWKAIWGTY